MYIIYVNIVYTIKKVFYDKQNVETLSIELFLNFGHSY